VREQISQGADVIKFTATGGAVSVRCGSGTEPGLGGHPAVFIEIADTGIGIPADQLDRIFEPFVQVAGGYTRQHGGAGLGLAISQKLARMMNGSITVHSEFGEGAVFTLWLPAADNSEQGA
jgi:signal transduction histidine kinase